MSMRLTEDVVRNRRFRLERGDGSLASAAIRLLKSRKIEGGRHPDEAYWDLQRDNSGQKLNFHAIDGRLSTSFDRFAIDADGNLTLEGTFLFSQSHARRRLVSVAPPSGKMWLSPLTSRRDRQPHRRLAVFVRSHLCDEKYRALMRKLDLNRDGYDLYGLIDETRGRNDPGPWPVVWHSLQGLSDMGLTQSHHALLHRCGDMALYFALRDLPSYRRYLMLDDDVELRGDDAAGMNELVRALAERDDLDFVGAFFDADPGRVWGPMTAEIYGAENAHIARFPMVAVSRRLCGFLFSQRLLEAQRHPAPDDIMNCEVFVASAAMAAGFSCADFNDVAPESYDLTLMMFESPGFGLPMGARFYGRTATAFYHPVYTETAWIGRTKEILTRANPRAGQVLFNLARRLRQARARDDSAMVGAIERLRLELDPAMGALLTGDGQHCRLGAPEAGEDEDWGETEMSELGPLRRLRGDTASWTRMLGAKGPAKLYVYVPVHSHRSADPEGVWSLEIDGAVTPLLWNWIDWELYAVIDAPAGDSVAFRLLKTSNGPVGDPRALAVLCANEDG